jgi:hypothetical protein
MSPQGHYSCNAGRDILLMINRSKIATKIFGAEQNFDQIARNCPMWT